MGLLDFLFFSTLANNSSHKRDNNSLNSHSYNNDCYARGYEDGYEDSCIDHDCYDDCNETCYDNCDNDYEYEEHNYDGDCDGCDW